MKKKIRAHSSSLNRSSTTTSRASKKSSTKPKATLKQQKTPATTHKITLTKGSSTKGKLEKVNLKLLTKAVNSVSRIPVTKITRSTDTINRNGSNANNYIKSSVHKVISTTFGSETGTVKPVISVRSQIDRVESNTHTVSIVLFKSGDKIVYPGHGVGEIEEIKVTSLGGQDHHIYNIKILDSGMKVMVPVSQAQSVGLRRIVDKKAIDQVYAILKDRDFKIDTQTWNRRFREYSQKIKTGSVYEIAIVLRDLSVLSADKELSFGEKKMLDMAESLLVSEIAIAKARPHDKIVGELRAIFS